MNAFSSSEILDVMFCNIVTGASRVLGEDWKSAFEELFVFALGGPTARSGVKRRTDGSSAQGIGSAFEVGLGLGFE